MNRRYLKPQANHGSQRGIPPVVVHTANILPGNGLLAGTHRMFGWKGARKHTSSLVDCGRACQGAGTIHPPAEDRGLSGLFLVIALVVPLSGCASTSLTAIHPTATPTAVPVLLFQADWSQGLARWSATPGWTIVPEAPLS